MHFFFILSLQQTLVNLHFRAGGHVGNGLSRQPLLMQQSGCLHVSCKPLNFTHAHFFIWKSYYNINRSLQVQWRIHERIERQFSRTVYESAINKIMCTKLNTNFMFNVGFTVSILATDRYLRPIYRLLKILTVSDVIRTMRTMFIY